MEQPNTIEKSGWRKSARRSVLRITLLFILLLFAACSLVEKPKGDELKERIQYLERNLLPGQSILKRMEHHQVPGLSIAVINDFELEWVHGFGVLDIRGVDPVTADTIFQVASISKPVTAVAALYYLEEGALDLHENVNDSLKSWKIPENEYTTQADVTLHGLLSHTAGINQGLYKGYLPSGDVPTLLEVLDGLPPTNSPPVRVDRVPGSEEYYSNGGYLIVVQLLEDVSGLSFPDLTEEVIFSPLGMTSSTFEQFLPDEIKSRVATGHGWDVENWQPHPGLPGLEKWRIMDPGCSGLWTTAPDLAEFAAEIMKAYQGESELIISQQTAQLMFQPVWEDIPLQEPYQASQALGFSLIDIGGATYWIHFGGAFPGYISALLADPQTGFGIVVLTNEWGGGYEIIWEIIYSILYEYGRLPTTSQVLQIAFSLIIFLAGLVWSGRYVYKWAFCKIAQKPKLRIGAIIILLLTLLGLLITSFLYRGPYGGLMVQDGGNSVLSKALLGLFFSSPLLLLVINIMIWVKRWWSRFDRFLFSLITVATLVVIYFLRDLWPLMFWG